ncbi:MAG: PQQ-binding-like beta-propeller repeat protein [Planctomycetaceae bacterium]|nr:PQQ-binding-like beta-propeller repeat protein [Planctomycetaceae bacterium]
MRFWMSLSVVMAAHILVVTHPAAAQHRVLTQGNDRLAIIEPDGRISWELKWGGIHDVHVLPNGHILVQQGAAKVAEIDPATKEVVWSYDSATKNGNAGKKIEVHAFQPLGDGKLMIAESGAGRIIEIDRDGKLLKEVALKIEHPHPHTDTRLARKLSSGNYLVCHEGDGTVREYDGPSGQLVWEYPVPMFGQTEKPGHGPEAFGNKCFAAVRLPNGNTLIATGNGHSAIEVTPLKKVVWEIHQRDLPGITLAWVTTLEVLPNGRYVLGNCHAGPGQPLLVEVDPKTKQVTWKLDRFDDFGNSVSNSVLLDVKGSLR